MTSSLNQYFTQQPVSSPPPVQPQPTQPGYLRRFWNGATWVMGQTAWGAARPLSWAFNPIGEGVGSGLVSGAKREFEQMVQPNSPIVSQLQESVEQALLKQAPRELHELRDLLKKALNKTDSLTKNDVSFIAKHLNELLDKDAKILKELAPDLNQTAIQLFNNTATMFMSIAETEHSDPGFLNTLKSQMQMSEEQKNIFCKDLKDCYEVFNAILEANQGALIQAMSFLQQALLSEEQGLISEAIKLLKRKATDENHGLMRTVLDQLTQLLDKEGGPIDLLTKRLTGGEKSIIGQAVTLLQNTLLEKDGIVDQIGKRFNDEENGIIAQALVIAKKSIETLNNQLLEEDGPFDLLQKKLLDKENGVLVRAINLLTLKLQSEGGPLDTIQKRLMDKDGILDQALNMLEDRLTHAEKGILVQAKQYLSVALLDEKTGILPQAIHLLDRKLFGEDGMIALLDVRLNHKETGILTRAAGVLQEKLMAKGGLVDQLDDKLTGQAHPLLSNSRKKLNELRKAIIDRNRAAIQKSSRELQPYLEQLTAHRLQVFNKQPLSEEDLVLINQLKEDLPHFSDHPSEQSRMLVTVEAGLAAINRYYGSQEGIAARTATILKETITEVLDPLLERVENIPKTMINNALGTSESSSEDGSSGTVSQFLGNGGSILKNLLSKGTQAVSQQAFSAFANILSFGIEQALGKMKNTPAFHQPRTTLNGIIETLNSARDNGNWSDLYQNLVKASEALKSVKIYINGFRIPRIGSEGVENAEGIYSDHISALQKATDSSSPEQENQDWITLAENEKNKLVDNATKYLTIKHIYEEVCHLQPIDDRFYMLLLAEAIKKGSNDDD